MTEETHNFTLYFKPEEYARIQELAAEKGLAVDDLCKQLLSDILDAIKLPKDKPQE